MVDVSPDASALRDVRMASLYDSEIDPIWTQKLGAMILDGLLLPADGQVLDAACRTGTLSAVLRALMPPSARLIAIDRSSELLGVARRKLTDAPNVFFRTEATPGRMAFADAVFDATVCNAELLAWPSPANTVADLARVTKPGGAVRLSVPLRGTFREMIDLLADALLANERHDALAALRAYEARFPTPAELATWCADARLAHTMTMDETSWIFASAEECFLSPVVEFGPLDDWRELASDEGLSFESSRPVLRHVRDSIAAYFGERPFGLTVRYATVHGTKRAQEEAAGALE